MSFIERLALKQSQVDVLDGDTAVSRRKKGKGKARQDPDEDDDELASEPDEKPEFINGLENIPPSSKLERSGQLTCFHATFC